MTETLVDSSYSLVQKSKQLLVNDDYGVFIHIPFRIGAFDNVEKKIYPMALWDLFASVGGFIYFTMIVGSSLLKPIQNHYEKLSYIKHFWAARTINNKIFPK